MIQYVPGWTYVSKVGKRTTLLSINGDRVTHMSNDSRTAAVIRETSLKNFQRWTHEARTHRLHVEAASVILFRGQALVFERNREYARELLR